MSLTPKKIYKIITVHSYFHFCGQVDAQIFMKFSLSKIFNIYGYFHILDYYIT
jgi:hypothetical protein